jgi:hypothetical protein
VADIMVLKSSCVGVCTPSPSESDSFELLELSPRSESEVSESELEPASRLRHASGTVRSCCRIIVTISSAGLACHSGVSPRNSVTSLRIRKEPETSVELSSKIYEEGKLLATGLRLWTVPRHSHVSEPACTFCAVV